MERPQSWCRWLRGALRTGCLSSICRKRSWCWSCCARLLIGKEWQQDGDVWGGGLSPIKIPWKFQCLTAALLSCGWRRLSGQGCVYHTPRNIRRSPQSTLEILHTHTKKKAQKGPQRDLNHFRRWWNHISSIFGTIPSPHATRLSLRTYFLM